MLCFPWQLNTAHCVCAIAVRAVHTDHMLLVAPPAVRRTCGLHRPGPHSRPPRNSFLRRPQFSINADCEKEDNAAASSVLLRHRYYYCRPRYQERITSSCHHYSSNYVKYYYALDHYPRPMGPHHKHNYIIDRPNTILSPRKQTPLDALWKLIHVPSTMAPRKPQWKRLRKWLLTWLHITAAETASGTAAEKAQEHCG